jgi:hypothetical protein
MHMYTQRSHTIKMEETSILFYCGLSHLFKYIDPPMSTFLFEFAEYGTLKAGERKRD